MLITTTHGELDESLLTKRTGRSSSAEWVEYYLGDELVHRSVTAGLTGVQATGVAAALGQRSPDRDPAGKRR